MEGNMKVYKFIISTLFIFLLFQTGSLAGNVIKMTYKTGGKEPLIGKTPNNSGAYLDLYTTASKMIDVKLKVIRLAKKRLHKKLMKGEVDFYPGASFSIKRSKYLYYIENGFETGEYGVTGLGIPAIKSFSDIKKNKLTWLMELGSSKEEIAKKLKIKTLSVPYMDLDKLQKFITKKGNKFFYIADKELVDYYLKSSGKKFKSFKDAGLEIHKDAAGGLQPMYLGFSQKSKLFSSKPNSNYKKGEKLSPSNFPIVVAEDCVAYNLQETLRKMNKSGETNKIYKKYFSK